MKIMVFKAHIVAAVALQPVGTIKYNYRESVSIPHNREPPALSSLLNPRATMTAEQNYLFRCLLSKRLNQK